MGGDYTRFTFDPTKDYSGVLEQQGRLSLDADLNELVEILNRRWRAETIDIIGRCIVPSSTPDAFRITPTGLGAFTIGIGRIYVDGLLAENHGLLAQKEVAKVLGEVPGNKPISFDDQPYYPKPLPAIVQANISTRTDLAYLDVWQREVTAIEDPEIKEIALGGPDTTTRLQTVWQVKVLELENVSAKSCAEKIAKWDTLVAPSAARLTVSAVAPPASDEPCVISPTGGYRGLENRLYRVEIHQAGVVGGNDPTKRAKFKWSRDNGSVVSAVEEITTDKTLITLKHLGRDQVLRFHVGDWVEVLDDHTEFKGEAGYMAKITKIDEANRRLTMSGVNSGTYTFDPSKAANRHTRVRRWDQKRDVDKNGLMDVTAGPIEIEDGVQVSFDPVGGSCKVGDYWVFAARTADGSIEPLDKAPPRGIIHHYCRLALITWGNNPPATATVTDCRKHWPPVCCTEVVYPGEDIQAALDRLQNDDGGCVCLKTGVHKIETPIYIKKSNVVLCGESPGSKVECNTGGNVLTIKGQSICNVAVKGIQFVPSASGIVGSDKVYAIDVAAPGCVVQENSIQLSSHLHGGIRVSGSDACVEKNVIQSCGAAAGAVFPLGVFVGTEPTGSSTPPDNVIIRGNRLLTIQDGVQDGVLDGILVAGSAEARVSGVQVVENQIEGQQKAGQQETVRFAVVVHDATESLVDGNQITSAQIGLSLWGGHGNRVYNNRIQNGGSGIRAFAETALEVSENTVKTMKAGAFTGLFLFQTTKLARNRFVSCGYDEDGPLAFGISTLFSFGDFWVESCELVNTGIDSAGRITDKPVHGISLWGTQSCQLRGNLVTYLVLRRTSDQTQEDRALFLIGLFGSAQVLDNKFFGSGHTHLIEFFKLEFSALKVGFEKVIFSNNYCEHIEVSRIDESSATISFWNSSPLGSNEGEGQLIVMGNHVKGVPRLPSMNFNGLKRVALLGNVTTEAVVNVGGIFVPTPAEKFNAILSVKLS